MATSFPADGMELTHKTASERSRAFTSMSSVVGSGKPLLDSARDA